MVNTTRSSPITVLVVEDNTDIREPMIVALKCMGYEAVGACDGVEALDLIRKYDYQLILCDIDMPLMNGIELFSICNNEKPESVSRFIFVTGGWTDESSDFIEKCGQPYMFKPFTFARLREVIKTLSET